ncbi:MAG: ChbG/HpnK family deacetylase [Alphaproteobacteria bacterium]|nr:ChbG/HpnK family deacetylase [Alphaproteobacteria bacterium]
MSLKIIFNADDFGISRGVNAAIVEAHTKGILNSTSLMVNQQFADEAVAAAKKMPALAVGLHLNLTNETPAANPAEIPLLVGTDGKLKNGFVNLLLLSILHPKAFAAQTEIEVRAQMQKFTANGLKPTHIDGHRHVHLIPEVFKIVRKIQEEYKIPRVRTMNENALNTILQNRSKSWLFDGGLVKYFILRFLTWWNGYKSDVYFYTILFTCKISHEQFRNIRIPRGYKAVEIMIHPGYPDIDKQMPDTIWDKNILSDWRTVELQTLLHKEVLNNIHETGENND